MEGENIVKEILEEIIKRKCHSNKKKEDTRFRHSKQQNLICKLGCDFRMQRIKLLKTESFNKREEQITHTFASDFSPTTPNARRP